MANSIGWGQGATNNSIGWGQGDINNNIGWGISQSLSYAGQTDITGGLYYLTSFVNTFSARVIADSGTFEATTCLYNNINGDLSNGGALTQLFKGRVSLDSGVFEADVCLINFCNSLT